MANATKTELKANDSKIVIHHVNADVRDLVLISLDMWIARGSDLAVWAKTLGDSPIKASATVTRIYNPVRAQIALDKAIDARNKRLDT